MFSSAICIFLSHWIFEIYLCWYILVLFIPLLFNISLNNYITIYSFILLLMDIIAISGFLFFALPFTLFCFFVQLVLLVWFVLYWLEIKATIKFLYILHMHQQGFFFSKYLREGFLLGMNMYNIGGPRQQSRTRKRKATRIRKEQTKLPVFTVNLIDYLENSKFNKTKII